MQPPTERTQKPLLLGRRIPLPALQLILLLFLSLTSIPGTESRTAAKRSAKIYRHAAGNNGEPALASQQPRAQDSGVYLESLDDLEHVAYLAMRNFNITDQSLIQSSWNSGANNGAHKQHQKVVVSHQAAESVGADSVKDRLALMLESFILHLRNGHLRQLKLEELREIVDIIGQQSQVNDSSLTTASGSSRARQQELVVAGESATAVEARDTKGEGALMSLAPAEWRDIRGQDERDLEKSLDSSVEYEDESHERCNQLVSLYVHEINLRRRSSSPFGQQQRVENGQMGADNKSGPSIDSQNFIDKPRLLRLCRLVVRCHSADELVGLLGGPWRDSPRPKRHARPTRNGSSAEVDAEPTYENYPAHYSDHGASSGRAASSASQARNLRDSLSQSLAKLCPLMLFQLHDEDGMCSFRKDDRPPMITVWAFATLFVTIVSFVSLIGLSIIPLLGPSADRTSTSSSNSELSSAGLTHQRQAAAASKQQQQQVGNGGLANKSRRSTGHQAPYPNHPHQHRACLTLFEGLAVGSLVGSALFSLIPQAFELQERESNQGFLLKALIIFFGIYLFFCSERIMRIILDTRQHRKRKRRCSNSLALPSTTVDNLVGFALSPTGVQQQQQQPRNNFKQRPSPFKDHHQHRVVAVQDLPAKTFGEQGKKSARITRQLGQRTAEIDTGRQASNRCTNLPAARASAGRAAEPSGDGENRRRRARRHERIKSAPTGADAGAARSATTRSERRQATRRHQSRTRRSKTAAGRRQKRKTRYQLLVQFKRLHSDSLTLPREGCELDKSQEEERLPLRARRGSLSSGGHAAAYDDFDSPSTHESGSSVEENYDSTTSLNSSSSESDSDDTDCYTRIALGQRSRQQHHMRSIAASGAQQARAPQLAAGAGGAPRRLATFHLQSGGHVEPSLYFHQADQTTEPGHQDVSADRRRPGSVNHAHNHGQPSEKQEISTVAWMIVLGDGLHNFIDGISIGAAFSESILSGVSISVAVICEEFPHELGDFAVLVSSGMTVRQALGYNFLSACTCYLGMAVGIILGDVNDGASYISALAAGVFLYIALVDMMGELSASLEESSRDSIGKTLKLLLLQNVGIFIGISIILVLSFIDF